MKSLSLSQPYLLVTVGIPGSGKTFFAEKFSATFNSPYVDYNLILDIAGQHRQVSDGFTGYLLQELFKTGQAVIFDGPAATRAERNTLEEIAASAGYACLFVWVQTDIDTARARFAKTAKLSGRRVSAKHFEAAVRGFVPPSATDHPTVVVSGKHTYATQVKAVLKNLATAKQAARSKKIPDRNTGQTIIPVRKRNTIR